MTTRAAVVHAPCGTIVGLEADGVRRLLGVPYAEPPVGRLRFASPRPRADFATPFDASRYGATPQRVPYVDTTTIPEPSIPGDDILTLNVFAPATPGEPLPVMVWLHGGGYVAGSAASPWYDGRSFVRDGVLVVTVAYRLALDGFGVLADAPSNLAIRDVLTALAWVRRNIAAFGGDPDRVTLAGQSAGGGLVLAVLASPASEGLVHRAIVASGVDVALSLEDAREATAELADRLGVAPDRAGLASISDHDIQLALRQDTDIDAIRLRPVIGDDILPLPLNEALGRYSLSVPLLIGATEDEFDADAPDPVARASGSRVTDILFRSVIPRVADARRAAPAGTWSWSFDWPSPVSGGAGHCIDLPFFFDLLHADGVTAALGAHPPRDLATALHGDVVRFIHGAEPDWPRAHGGLGDAARSYGHPGRPVVAVDRGAFDPVVALPVGGTS